MKSEWMFRMEWQEGCSRSWMCGPAEECPTSCDWCRPIEWASMMHVGYTTRRPEYKTFCEVEQDQPAADKSSGGGSRGRPIAVGILALPSSIFYRLVI